MSHAVPALMQNRNRSPPTTHLDHEDVVLHKVQVEHVIGVHEGLGRHREAVASPNISPCLAIRGLKQQKLSVKKY